MAGNPLIIGLGPWFETAAGRVLRQWSQQHIDLLVADLFGFHALQLGLPELDALRANRMPHRWLADCVEGAPLASAQVGDGGAVALWCDFDALPFDSQSLDLVVLPHTLEWARDPHLALREVERVLRPEGRVLLLGFNPASLWGVRQWLGRWLLRMGVGRGGLFLPAQGELFGHRRVRDWLRLLSFEVEENRWGCYGLPWQSERRLDWLERAGARWWPGLGAAHIVVAVKRVRGMRLVGLLRQPARTGKAAPAVALNQHSHKKHRSHEH